MFFTFHSSLSSITIKSDDSFHCFFKVFFESSCSKFDANFEWIFIVNDSFSQYACSISIRILKSFSILSSSFFNDLEIMMFLEFRNIMSFILQIISFQCLLICFFIVTLTLANACLINASDHFMCSNIFFALLASILAWVISYSVEFKSKLIQEWKFLFRKNTDCLIDNEIALLLTNSVIDNQANCENTSHWLWTMHVCKTSLRD